MMNATHIMKIKTLKIVIYLNIPLRNTCLCSLNKNFYLAVLLLLPVIYFILIMCAIILLFAHFPCNVSYNTFICIYRSTLRHFWLYTSTLKYKILLTLIYLFCRLMCRGLTEVSKLINYLFNFLQFKKQKKNNSCLSKKRKNSN